MTVETFVAGLSRPEKLLAMELIWRDLRNDGKGLESPSWHDDEVNRRLANPLARIIRCIWSFRCKVVLRKTLRKAV